jgi:Right handed beta helix region
MRRVAIFTLLAGFLAPILASAPAHAQNTRTWVSGTGDDLNPCSRTAPCKTFAAAIAVTDTNGEIDCVDAGGYGTLTITKSITIDCTGTLGSILSSGVNGITINLTTSPDPLASVVLRGLSLNGTSGGAQSGLRGVSIQSAAVVTLEDMVIMYHAQQGVADVRTTPGKLFIKNSVIRNNAGIGIVAAASGGTNMVSIENTHAINNLYGLATGNGNQVKIARSVFSGNSTAGIEADPGAQVGVEHSTVNFNGTGLQAFGTIWIDDTEISFNQSATAGTPVSFGNNRFYANITPPGSLAAGPASTDRGQN